MFCALIESMGFGLFFLFLFLFFQESFCTNKLVKVKKIGSMPLFSFCLFFSIVIHHIAAAPF